MDGEPGNLDVAARISKEFELQHVSRGPRGCHSDVNPFTIGSMELLTSPQEFFHEAVTSAMKSQQLSASEAASFYLVNLLCEFTRTRIDSDPLALKLAQARSLAQEERAPVLKQIADQTLYMSGLFPDHLSRRLVSVEYYMELGGIAYHELAAMPRLTSACLREVYEELSDKFSGFVVVLREMRQSMSIYPSTNLLRIYEQWRKTGSQWLEERLRACGVIVPKTAAVH
jgi:hypothetical protein